MLEVKQVVDTDYSRANVQAQAENQSPHPAYSPSGSEPYVRSGIFRSTISCEEWMYDILLLARKLSDYVTISSRRRRCTPFKCAAPSIATTHSPSFAASHAADTLAAKISFLSRNNATRNILDSKVS